MTKRLYRNIQALLLFLSLMVIGASFYFQYAKGMQPCPLCLMQRGCVFLLGIACLTGLCLSTLKRARLMTAIQVIVSLAGLYFAGRQLWLQSLPADQAPACMPDLSVLIHYFPWQDVFHALFWGAADCAEPSASWWGLSMPVWALAYFLVMLFAAVLTHWRLGKTAEQFDSNYPRRNR